MVYVYFQNPTCHRDFTITVFLIIWLRRQSSGKDGPGLGSRAIFLKPRLHYRSYSPLQAFPLQFCHFNATVDVYGEQRRSYGEQRRSYNCDMIRCTAIDATGMATNGPDEKYSRGVLSSATAAVALGCQMATAKLEICVLLPKGRKFHLASPNHLACVPRVAL